MDLHGIRREYENHPLDEKTFPADPMPLLIQWLEEAQQKAIPDANAALLSTVSSEGYPSCRAILIKEVTDTSLIFYTHTTSRKGKELAGFPYAALTFLWTQLERQIRIEGSVALLDPAEVERYWKTRPRASQISAACSSQDAVILSREALDLQYREIEKRFEGKEIPLPTTWGGYRLISSRIEFWQGGARRLHDRIVYLFHPEQKKWGKVRLSP